MTPKRGRDDAHAAGAEIVPSPAIHAAALVPFAAAPVPLVRAGGGSLVAAAAPISRLQCYRICPLVAISLAIARLFLLRNGLLQFAVTSLANGLIRTQVIWCGYRKTKHSACFRIQILRQMLFGRLAAVGHRVLENTTAKTILSYLRLMTESR